MKVALIQAPLAWENIEENKQTFLKKLNSLSEDTELVVLPEMFTSGFTMRPERVSMGMSDMFIGELISLCKSRHFALTGSIVIEENSRYYNRMFFIFPTGEVKTYDKRHLFSLAGEEKVYTAGQERLIVEYKGWKICPLVCYDLRFPAFSRNVGGVYDLLLYVASWPDQRIYAWDSLIKARSIENMSYVVGVNRSGSDENNNVYSGHSQVLDTLGNYLVEPLVGEQVVYVELDKEKQDKLRQRFGFLKDADDFTLLR
ncbi:nitrilase family protein [Myroides phaeus]|uniref:Omega-amidase YafV n=1 Tax=Myroides phaeus TaxID=702745 RepID=A0A1G8G9F8_9FLAO|nr:nitrilase family protein [Myroides phaeus]MEC4116531.1 nitrilase family protein [Myroides phaeus]SDH91014.1 Predicted amidohydrolase [Myroides phaeus]